MLQQKFKDFDMLISVPSNVILLVCLVSLFCCISHDLFLPGFRGWTDDLTFVSKLFWHKVEFIIVMKTASSPGLVAAKQDQIITPPTTTLAACMSGNMICCVSFAPNMALCIMTEHLHLGLINPKYIVPEPFCVCLFRGNFVFFVMFHIVFWREEEFS